MLYCSYSWWSERGFSGTLSNVQIRPTLAESALLAGSVGFGIIQNVEKTGDFIVPRSGHPVTQRFYSDGPPPHPLKELISPDMRARLASCDETSIPRTEVLSPAAAMRSRKTVTFEVKKVTARDNYEKPKDTAISSTRPVSSFQPFSLKPALKSVQNMVNSSLDPRRRRCAPSNATFESSINASISPSRTQADRYRPYQHIHLNSKKKDSAMDIDTPPAVPPQKPRDRMQVTFHTSRNCDRSHNRQEPRRLLHGEPSRTGEVRDFLQSKSKSRIQELEDRVLVLEKTIVTKDREIRRLKDENKELRKEQRWSDISQTGTKRARYDRDGIEGVLDRIGGVLKDLK